MPTFSVIIPCYNCVETIDATIDSLRMQSLTDWEAICVDDGSSDATLDRLERHAQTEPRIRIIQQQNMGPSRARNAAAATARGEYLAFLDSDDLWLPEKLTSVAKTFQANPKALAVFGRVGFFHKRSSTDATTSTVKAGEQSLNDVIGQNPVCTLSNLSVRRDAFLNSGGFEEEMRFSEDLEWLVRVISNGWSVVATNEMHMRYRTSPDGLSADLIAMHKGWRRALASAATDLSEKQLRAAEAVHLRYLARRALRTGTAPRQAFSLAWHGLSLSPRAFLGDRHRGPMTLLGCLLMPICPPAVRQRLFA